MKGLKGKSFGETDEETYLRLLAAEHVVQAVHWIAEEEIQRQKDNTQRPINDDQSKVQPALEWHREQHWPGYNPEALKNNFVWGELDSRYNKDDLKMAVEVAKKRRQKNQLELDKRIAEKIDGASDALDKKYDDTEKRMGQALLRIEELEKDNKELTARIPKLEENQKKLTEDNKKLAEDNKKLTKTVTELQQHYIEQKTLMDQILSIVTDLPDSSEQDKINTNMQQQLKQHDGRIQQNTSGLSGIRQDIAKTTKLAEETTDAFWQLNDIVDDAFTELNAIEQNAAKTAQGLTELNNTVEANRIETSETVHEMDNELTETRNQQKTLAATTTQVANAIEEQHQALQQMEAHITRIQNQVHRQIGLPTLEQDQSEWRTRLEMTNFTLDEMVKILTIFLHTTPELIPQNAMLASPRLTMGEQELLVIVPVEFSFRRGPTKPTTMPLNEYLRQHHNGRPEKYTFASDLYPCLEFLGIANHYPNLTQCGVEVLAPIAAQQRHAAAAANAQTQASTSNTNTQGE